MLKDSIDADEQDTYLIDYLFDLNGYIILKNAIRKDDLCEMNQWVDDHWEYVLGQRRSRKRIRAPGSVMWKRIPIAKPMGAIFRTLLKAGRYSAD